MKQEYQEAISSLEKLEIGKVEYVSAQNIEVMLLSEAPHNLALNTGSPLAFPLINNCLLIPNEKGYLVGLVSKLRVEKERINPRSYQHKAEDFLGMPSNKRIVSLAPMGTLTSKEGKKRKVELSMERGTISFPAIGNPVHVPTRIQLETILGASDENDKRIYIGTLAHDTSIDVGVDPNKIFGRHLAVLGNTGSGKSCTIAGLIHWSVKAAKVEAETIKANAIEWAKETEEKATKADKEKGLAKDNLHAAEEAAREAAETAAMATVLSPDSNEIAEAEREAEETASRVGAAMANVKAKTQKAEKADAIAKDAAKTAEGKSGKNKAKFIILDINGEYAQAFKGLNDKALILYADSTSNNEYPGEQLKVPWGVFTNKEWKVFLQASPGVQYPLLLQAISSTPKTNTVNQFFEKIKQIRDDLYPQPKDQIWVNPMIERMEVFLKDEILKTILNASNNAEERLWPGEEERNVIIIDLSTMSDDTLHIITSVIARKIFEEHKYSKDKAKTVLVLDEAHRFIGEKPQKSEDIESLNSNCTNCFSRIAREGRKFGLNLVIASQMPHDVSRKVVSQCNTFLLHRIVSGVDQKYVKQLVPDALGELMDELPSLPSQYAFLLGHASSMPKLIRINNLARNQRPDSADPQIWENWIGES